MYIEEKILKKNVYNNILSIKNNWIIIMWHQVIINFNKSWPIISPNTNVEQHVREAACGIQNKQGSLIIWVNFEVS